MILLWAVLLCLLLALGWLLQLVGLPGNWLMVVSTLGYAYFVPPDSSLAIGAPVVWTTIGLAMLAEVLELVAGAMGVAKVGGSRRSAVLALIGSIIGGIAGVVIGVPIPIVGSFVAALLFAGLGALVGAMLGESWKGRQWDQTWQVGQAAFWGRLLGTLAKTLIGSVIVAVVLVAIVL